MKTWFVEDAGRSCKTFDVMAGSTCLLFSEYSGPVFKSEFRSDNLACASVWSLFRSAADPVGRMEDWSFFGEGFRYCAIELNGLESVEGGRSPFPISLKD